MSSCVKFRLLLVCCVPLLSGVTACSVKESRGGCPVYININFDGIIARGQYDEGFVAVEDKFPVVEEELRLREYELTGYEVPASRGPVRMAAAFDYHSYSWHHDTLRVKEGAESSRLFIWSEKAICEDDLYFTDVTPFKQYCLMNIIIVGLLPGQDFAYDLRLKGNCNGMALYDRDPIEGDYTVVATHKNASGYEIVVPRQRENSIVLELLLPDRDHIYADSDLVSVLDVGAVMEAGGYDWEKVNLDDVNVVVDFSRMKASIEVVAWNEKEIDAVI